MTFIITIQNNPSVINEFDEDKEVQQYLDELMKEKENVEYDTREKNIHN